MPFLGFSWGPEKIDRFLLRPYMGTWTTVYFYILWSLTWMHNEYVPSHYVQECCKGLLSTSQMCPGSNDRQCMICKCQSDGCPRYCAATVCIMGWKLRQTRQRAAKVDTGGISDDNAASAHSDMHTWPEPTAAEECQQLKSVEWRSAVTVIARQELYVRTTSWWWLQPS